MTSFTVHRSAPLHKSPENLKGEKISDILNKWFLPKSLESIIVVSWHHLLNLPFKMKHFDCTSLTYFGKSTVYMSNCMVM